MFDPGAIFGSDFLAYEKAHLAGPLTEWSQNHAELPIFAATVYLVMVFYMPKFIKTAFNLRPFLAAWNLTLSIFSIVGASRCVPALLNLLQNGGLVHSVCGDVSYLNGASGFWVALFIYSKFFELMDTAFLILRKREVIFLHWFHHLTVLMFCWHAYCLGVSSGLWFAAMNYSVHSIMYLYYFLMVFRAKTLRKVLRSLAPGITTIQLLQMVGGIVVNFVAARSLYMDPSSCYVHPSSWKLGLGMYLCYFVLFAMLFKEKFLTPKAMKPQICVASCHASDAAGMFRSDSSADLPNAKKKIN